MCIFRDGVTQRTIPRKKHIFGTMEIGRRTEMLKEYDEIAKCDSMGVSHERALWNIARELSRRNDLLEIDMLCKTAETLKSVAKGSLSNLHEEGWAMAEELVCMAHKKICAITKTPEGLTEEGEDKDE